MAKGVPEGWHSVTPRLVAKDVAALVEFLRLAFYAEGTLQTERPSQMRIGDSLVMVSGAEMRDTTTSFIYLYVENADLTYGLAMAAGAESLEEPCDTPYGDRRAMIKDPAGNTWQIATHNEEAYRDFLKQQGLDRN